MPAVFESSKNVEIAKLHKLQEQAAAQVDRAKEIEAIISADGREMTEEEEREFTQCLDNADTLEAEYKQRLAEDEKSVRRAALDERQERLNRLPQARTLLTKGAYSSITSVRNRIMDDPRRHFASFGEFAMIVQGSSMPGAIVSDERLLEISAAVTGLNQAQGSQGGFLVPPQFSQMIWDGMNEMPDNLMQYCDTYPVTGESLTFNANAETSRATGSRYGGIRAYWLAEAAQKTASMPRFRQMKLEPHELAVLVYVTDKLLRNAPALESYLRKAATEEIMWLVNDAIINGTGAGQPLGIMNSPALISIAKETNQPADTVELDNINKMYARFLSRARVGGAWYINQDLEAELENLSANVGTGGFPVYLPSPTGFPTITEMPNSRLKGRPVRPVEFMQTLGDKGDILLANLDFYALGVQGGIQEALSIHLRFDYNETAFRFVFAVDGQPWIAAPRMPAHGSNTLSPFVTLDARA
jgi:HK97 family phage major capsid protein